MTRTANKPTVAQKVDALQDAIVSHLLADTRLGSRQRAYVYAALAALGGVKAAETGDHLSEENEAWRLRHFTDQAIERGKREAAGIRWPRPE